MRPSRTRSSSACFCLFFAYFVFYIPNFLGHPDNYIPANPGQTPTHIVPEWYYLPFYAILRAIPSKLLGVIALVLFDRAAGVPALARHLEGAFGQIPAALPAVPDRVLPGGGGLGYLGSQPPEGGYVIAARFLTAYYFVFLLIILPLLGLFETTKPLPNSILESVLHEGVPIGASAPPPSGAKV